MVRPRETDARFIVRDTSGQALASARVALNLVSSRGYLRSHHDHWRPSASLKYPMALWPRLLLNANMAAHLSGLGPRPLPAKDLVVESPCPFRCLRPAVPKASIVPSARWLYYFNVSDIDSAAERVKTAGGQVFNGPVELPSGNTMVQCKDPQGGSAKIEYRLTLATSAGELAQFRQGARSGWRWHRRRQLRRILSSAPPSPFSVYSSATP
jgi:hypothetical protein